MASQLGLPMSREDALALKYGDSVSLSGIIYTARDAAHARLVQLIAEGKPLPLDILGAAVYYVGPTPAPPGRAIGSAGPTTSYRMDAYTPELLARGLRVMIGKGERSPEVVSAMQEAGAVYLGAIGGAGALLGKCVKKAEVIAFPELGAEAIHRLEVENFPAYVIIDSRGDNLYRLGRGAYLDSLNLP